MPDRRTQAPTTTAVSTALLLGLSGLTTTGCGNDRIVADARGALGTQLGSEPRTGSAVARGPSRQAASVDDLMTARRYLEATLRLDPGNAGARAALAGLGGVAPDEIDLPFGNVERMPGPVASRATPGRIARSLTRVAFGDVGTFGADLADAVRPWAKVAAVTLPSATPAADSAESLAAIVGARSAASDSAARDSSAQVARRARTRLRTAAARRSAKRDATLAAREDSTTRADTVQVADAAAPRKHKRTWPWTRMQRWLVAKGMAGGAGAGVVVGAIIGNVPGALLAGSLGGGALGFKKATRIGPAAPYPSVRDSAAFDAEKRARDLERARKAKADTTAKVAVARP